MGAIVDMENIIKKNFIIVNKDSAQSDIVSNNPVQATLREEFEIMNQEMQDIKKKHKALLLNQSQGRDKESQQNNQYDMATQLENSKKELQMKDIQLENNKKQLKTLEMTNNQLRTKLREADDKNNKLEGHMIPKLRETISRQKDVSVELEQIHLDSQLLPAMFRAEAMFRKECKKDKDEAVTEMTKAMKQHNKLMKKIEDLENELSRKQRLSIQAIAARSSMKVHLDEAK